MERLTDDEIRMDLLVEEWGLTVSQARQYIEDNPKPTTVNESAVILSVRLNEMSRIASDEVHAALKKLRKQ